MCKTIQMELPIGTFNLEVLQWSGAVDWCEVLERNFLAERSKRNEISSFDFHAMTFTTGKFQLRISTRDLSIKVPQLKRRLIKSVKVNRMMEERSLSGDQKNLR